MKIIGNRNGSFLVADEIDETSDDWMCTVDAEGVTVNGDSDGECSVTFEQQTEIGYGRHRTEKYTGKFSSGVLVGQFEPVFED